MEIETNDSADFVTCTLLTDQEAFGVVAGQSWPDDTVVWNGTTYRLSCPESGCATSSRGDGIEVVPVEDAGTSASMCRCFEGCHAACNGHGVLQDDQSC